MKLIVGNKFITIIKFSFLKDMVNFYDNQETRTKLLLKETEGRNHYCYLCSHSLTKEIIFVICFSSDEEESVLNFVFFNQFIVLDTGKQIYFLDENLNVQISHEITSSLIGLYIINDNLLILEEAYLRIVDSKGVLLKSELFDLIEDFCVKDDVLTVKTSEETKEISLM